jgi:hypothetical protein
MKKIFTVLLLVIFLTPALMNAQFHLSVGPVTGLNFNIHTGSDLSKTATGFGLVFGGQCDMQFTKTFGLLTTIYFYDGRYGSSSESQSYYGNSYDVESSGSIAYFSIEPLAKFKLSGSNLYLLAGPSLGFNMESEAEVEYSGAYSGKSKATLKDMNVRFELKAGAGYDFNLSRLLTLAPHFTIGYGLTNVQKDVSWKIMTFQAGCALKFNLI